MDAATKTYEEMKEAFLKLDDARFYLNRIMGPNGSMTQGERKLYLKDNIEEHDKLIASEPRKALPNARNSIQNQLTASIGSNPVKGNQL